LLDTGYVWGKNVMVEERWANAQYDQLPALAADLVRHQVAAIRRHGCFRELRTLVGQSGRPPRCGQPPPVS
jgi:hypothetical protein